MRLDFFPYLCLYFPPQLYWGHCIFLWLVCFLSTSIVLFFFSLVSTGCLHIKEISFLLNACLSASLSFHLVYNVFNWGHFFRELLWNWIQQSFAFWFLHLVSWVEFLPHLIVIYSPQLSFWLHNLHINLLCNKCDWHCGWRSTSNMFSRWFVSFPSFIEKFAFPNDLILLSLSCIKCIYKDLELPSTW